MQSKLEIWEPTVMAGIYLWLMGYRLLAGRFAVRGRLPLAWVGGLGIAAAVLTAAGEALYFWLAYGADPEPRHRCQLVLGAGGAAGRRRARARARGRRRRAAARPC